MQKIKTDASTQRPTATSEQIPMNYNHNRYAEEYNQNFEKYLKGQVSSLDIVKLNNLLVTKRYNQTKVIVNKRSSQPRISRKFENQDTVNFEEVKEFLTSRDTAKGPLCTQRSKRQASEYENSKAVDQVRLISESYRDRILSKNLVSLSDAAIRGKIRIRGNQLTVIKPKDDPKIVQRIKEMRFPTRLLSESPERQPTKAKRASSEFLFLKPSADPQSKANSRSLNRTIKVANLRSHPCGDDPDDESLISETEGKYLTMQAQLNNLYVQTRKYQSKLLHHNVNTSNVISTINKIDQIQKKILRVNNYKLQL